MNNVLKKLLYALLAGLFIGAAVSAGLLLAKFYFHGRFPAGINVAGTSLGYKTVDEAVSALEEREKEYLSIPLKFQLEEKNIEISPSEIDLKFFAKETVSTIKRIDLTKENLWANFKKEKSSAEILYTFDEEKLFEVLDQKLDLKKIAPQNATYTGGLVITEEKPGKKIDYETILEETKNLLSSMEPVDLTLALEDASPTITKVDLEKIKPEMEDKLKNKITFEYGKQKWTFKPMDGLDWIIFEEAGKVTIPYLGKEIELKGAALPDNENIKRYIKIGINGDKLNEYIDKNMVEGIEVAVEAVSIYKDEEGNVKIEGAGRDGIQIQRGTLKKSLELAINDKISKITVYTRTLRAPVAISADLQEMGIKELIGVGHTSFYGSHDNRVHNIKTGIAKLNGSLVAPLEEFSILSRLGPVDGSTGYKKELVITKRGTIPEYGGGLCQVSTTMYRAALFSGLKITDRAAHSYAVTYYSQVLGHGLDATIYSGGQDLKFINDTPGYILIQGTVEGLHAYFKFYGTGDGRSVAMDGPYLANYKYPSKDIIYENSDEIPIGTTKLVEKRNTGFEATWYRTITRPDGTSEKEEIFSHYKTTQEKYWVGAPSGSVLPPSGPEQPEPLP